MRDYVAKAKKKGSILASFADGKLGYSGGVWATKKKKRR